jgi:hypothetical protein
MPRPQTRNGEARHQRILSASEQLTKFEIEALRRGQKPIEGHAQKHLTGWAAKPAE